MAETSTKFEGRGGQQLLLARRPFCPGRDCLRRCGPLDCTCDPCRCSRCAARRRRRVDITPDLIGRTFNPAPIQPALFPSPRRSVRRP